MTFTLPDLPFAKDALGTFMSAETLDFHHGKHHRAYVDKTNELLADADLDPGSLTGVIRAAREKGDKGLFNNAAQFWNHNFFWQCLAPPEGQKPAGKLAAMIEDAFGTTDELLAKLKAEAVGHFGSGWAWLVLDRDALRITSLHDADTPVVHAGKAIALALGIGLGAAGAGPGIGFIFGSMIQSVARQPELRGELQGIMWLGFALTEAVVFYGFLGGLLGYVLV